MFASLRIPLIIACTYMPLSCFDPSDSSVLFACSESQPQCPAEYRCNPKDYCCHRLGERFDDDLEACHGIPADPQDTGLSTTTGMSSTGTSTMTDDTASGTGDSTSDSGSESAATTSTSSTTSSSDSSNSSTETAASSGDSTGNSSTTG